MAALLDHACPAASTTMRSARAAVARRWATMTVVRPRESAPMAEATRASLRRSRLDVASSSRRTAGSTRRARARASNCRWPLDSDRPRSRIIV